MSLHNKNEHEYKIQCIKSVINHKINSFEDLLNFLKKVNLNKWQLEMFKIKLQILVPNNLERWCLNTNNLNDLYFLRKIKIPKAKLNQLKQTLINIIPKTICKVNDWYLQFVKTISICDGISYDLLVHSFQFLNPLFCMKYTRVNKTFQKIVQFNISNTPIDIFIKLSRNTYMTKTCFSYQDQDTRFIDTVVMNSNTMHHSTNVFRNYVLEGAWAHSEPYRNIIGTDHIVKYFNNRKLLIDPESLVMVQFQLTVNCWKYFQNIIHLCVSEWKQTRGFKLPLTHLISIKSDGINNCTWKQILKHLCLRTNLMYLEIDRYRYIPWNSVDDIDDSWVISKKMFPKLKLLIFKNIECKHLEISSPIEELVILEIEPTIPLTLKSNDINLENLKNLSIGVLYLIDTCKNILLVNPIYYSLLTMFRHAKNLVYVHIMCHDVIRYESIFEVDEKYKFHFEFPNLQDLYDIHKFNIYGYNCQLFTKYLPQNLKVQSHIQMKYDFRNLNAKEKNRYLKIQSQKLHWETPRVYPNLVQIKIEL